MRPHINYTYSELHEWMHLLHSQTQHMPCHGDKDSLIVEVQEFGSEWNVSDTRDFIFIDAVIYREKIQVSYRSCTTSV